MTRRHLFILVDTETANSLNDPLVYNIAWCIIDQYGNVYAEGNFINIDVFYGMPDLMRTAYYAEKIPQYIEQINRGEVIPATWYEIKRAFNEMCEAYNIRAFIAHNARFDYNACNTTQRYETSSKYRYFFPKDIEIWDTMRMARDVICIKPSYIKFCAENGYITQNCMPKATAEVLYRFITKDNEFVEEHKAMEDVAIEREIFWYCVRQHKAMRRKCFND